MDTQLPLPIVTPDDLLKFHVRNYGTHFPGSIPSFGLTTTGPEQSDELYMEDNLELGYYDDGAKRTLTDGQIAMFRHSEIQGHLRDQRRNAEKETSEFVSVARSTELQDGVWGVQEVVHDGDEEEEGEVKNDDDEEEEYEKFLVAEQREMELAASRQKMATDKNQKSKTGKSSTRRIVRELDEVTDSVDVLDYGE